ncbi:MAG TPA: two-component regulator propeller domain-containing protein, partial [Arenimonas sp.]|nr:two-component regulator propeller domain-containing protein [Arenimonas sp.]
YRFLPYRHDPEDPTSLGEDSIRDLLPLPDGKLWVATQGGGISVYDPLQDRFERLQHDPDDPRSLSDRAVLKLAQAHDGGIWLGTANHGLDYWDPAQKQFRHYPADPDNPGAVPHATVRTLLVDPDGSLWAGTRNGLVRLRVGSEQFERVASNPNDPNSLHGQYVYSLHRGSDGRIWVGTQNDGIAVVDPASGRFERLFAAVDGELADDPARVLSHPWISTLIEPHPGQVWALTFGAGIDIIDSARLRVIKRVRHDPAVPNSLALDLPTQPLIDRSGLLWIGTWGAGLQRHNPTARAFSSFRYSPLRDDGLSNAAVHAALSWDDGRIWIGTGGNGIDVFDRERGFLPGLRAHPVRAGALRDGTVRALARTTDGSVWVGTQQAGLHRWLGEDEGFRVIAGAGGSDDERIILLHALRDGGLLVASQRGAAELDPASERVMPLRLDDGELFSDTVTSFADDADGNLWVASAIGLLVRRQGSDGLTRVWAAPERAGGLSQNNVLSLHVDGRGQLWLATAGGIERLVGWQEGQPQFAPLPLPDRRAAVAFGGNRMISDAQGRLWTERLLVDTTSAQVHEFGRPDGVDLGSVSLGAAARLPDGQLLFGGTRGFVIVDPSAYQPWNFDAAPVVTALRVDGQPLPLSQLQNGLSLSSEQRRLEVEYSALDLSAPERVRYAYRLEGYEQDWVEGDAGSRAAHYSKLWPGSYTLRVRASNRDGRWSATELEIPLQVLPAWWQTPSFVLVLALALLAILLLGVRLRTARIRDRASALEELVRRRTGELSQAKEQAEQTLAELQGTQKQLVAAEKMASLGQLVAGVAHEINTPIGIAVTATSHLKEVSKVFAAKVDGGKLTRNDLSSWRAAVEEAVHLVLGSLERAHSLIGSFKQVAVDQSSEQRRHIELQTFLGEVEFALKPSYKRTPHDLSVDCPEGIELDTYPGALFQIFTNLVNNSMLHGFAQGQAGQMRIVARARDDQVYLLYSDNGRGMSPETAARAFDPFFTTRRGSGGSGLGLHLVYNLITRLLGGHVELHSTPGEGTEFEIRIPKLAPVRSADDADAGH